MIFLCVLSNKHFVSNKLLSWCLINYSLLFRWDHMTKQLFSWTALLFCSAECGGCLNNSSILFRVWWGMNNCSILFSWLWWVPEHLLYSVQLSVVGASTPPLFCSAECGGCLNNSSILFSWVWWVPGWLDLLSWPVGACWPSPCSWEPSFSPWSRSSHKWWVEFIKLMFQSWACHNL